MRKTLATIAARPGLDLSLIVTGMHLLPAYGMTVREVEETGLPIRARIDSGDAAGSGAGMARGIARIIAGCVDALEASRPDILLVLGDRGEMLAGAIAALHLNIPIAHLHGGERSGTVDEPVRHAISKLAHIHLPATAEGRERLVRMGEEADRVFVVGAPGLDGLGELATVDRAALCAGVGFDPRRPVALLVFHPVVQEAGRGAEALLALVGALVAEGCQILAMTPNSDGGGSEIRAALEASAARGELHLETHLRREAFISWMAAADVMVGNSSSGIIEAASFGTPVLNIGSRQNLRERNANTRDIADPHDIAGIGTALREMLAHGRFPAHNRYGDGKSATRIADILQSVDLSPALLAKANAY